MAVASLIGINIILWKIFTHMILNSLLYLHDLQMKHVDAYRDLIRRLHSYIDEIHILPTGYFPINLVSHPN